MAELWQSGGFGLYVHWPFCAAKCPYCDFNSHVERHIDQEAWAQAYELELERVARETPSRVLHTIFFGGGTPSLMPPQTVARVIDAARKHWPTANDMEITLEANPTSVEAGRFADFHAAGVNRVSLGVQALNDADLVRLGRMHSADEARAAFEIARKQFARVSFDLIYARQDQSLAAWESELTQALSMGIDHLSLYQLTIEEGTAFAARHAAGGLAGLPSEGLAADMYEATQELCARYGLPRYEVSNHARPGADSRHNLIYWRSGDFVGIGPGAHGRVTLEGSRFATESWRAPRIWLEAALGGSGEQSRERLDLTDQMHEFLLMGLRLSEGIDLARLEALPGAEVAQANISSLVDQGLLAQTGTRIRATERGTMLLNSVLAALVEERPLAHQF